VQFVETSCIAAPTWTPIHVQENQPTLTGYPLWRFFGTGVVVSIPKKKWGVITPKDLDNAEPKIRKNDILMINTGSHKKYGDNPDYYAYSPGLYKEAAEWIVERGVRLVGIDVQALDHPLGTFLGPHGPGPAQPHLDDEYFAETGRHIIDDFPHWEPAHKIMMTNGIPGIENIGGESDKIAASGVAFAFSGAGRRQGCARVVAVLDPTQAFAKDRNDARMPRHRRTHPATASGDGCAASGLRLRAAAPSG
jgi:kynurenine formamidase